MIRETVKATTETIVTSTIAPSEAKQRMRVKNII